MTTWSSIESKYRTLMNVKVEGNVDNTIEKILEIYNDTCRFLATCERIDLISKIPGKSYFAFGAPEKYSRAVNKDLYVSDTEWIARIVANLSQGNTAAINSSDITKALYSIAISFCATVDLHKTSDQKTPGTYFEYFVCTWFVKLLGIVPRNNVEVLNLDMNTTLPTDFIFDLGHQRPKIHLPVKTSTRERVIQVWAHQRVLDGVYGTGRFLGMLVCLSETKVTKQTREVTEICLPDQWRLYQLFIAQMTRIYYLDPPKKYIELNNIFPPFNVRPFGEFFGEISTLIGREVEE